MNQEEMTEGYQEIICGSALSCPRYRGNNCNDGAEGSELTCQGILKQVLVRQQDKEFYEFYGLPLNGEDDIICTEGEKRTQLEKANKNLDSLFNLSAVGGIINLFK